MHKKNIVAIISIFLSFLGLMVYQKYSSSIEVESITSTKKVENDKIDDSSNIENKHEKIIVANDKKILKNDQEIAHSTKKEIIYNTLNKNEAETGLGYDEGTFLPYYTILNSIDDVGWDLSEEYDLPNKGYFSNVLPVSIDMAYLITLTDNNIKIPNISLPDSVGNTLDLTLFENAYQTQRGIKFYQFSFTVLNKSNSVTIVGHGTKTNHKFRADIYTNGVVSKLIIKNNTGYILNK